MPKYIEYVTKIASLLSQRDKVQYAFLLTPGGKVICAGSHVGNATDTYETALVNALQNNFNLISRDQSIAVCSYWPTEMCVGMAHLLGIHGVWGMYNGTPNIVPMKGGWPSATFESKTPKLMEPCQYKATFAWKTVLAEALVQAADSAEFTPDAISMLKAMQASVLTANSTRSQESAQLAGALKTLPISAPPGAGAFADADLVYTHIVFGMVGQTWNPTMQAVSRDVPLTSGEGLMGNNIAGLLLDENFQVVAWALNFSAENPTFHAETLMLQRFLRDKGLKKLPPNYTVYTSLQPCDMCGSFLLHVGNNTKVIYCLRDVSLSTVLTKSKSGTSERLVSIKAATEIATKLRIKNQTSQTHSANLLRDGEDASYRNANHWFLFDKLWLNRNSIVLSAADREDLEWLQNKKATGGRLKKGDFDWMVATENKLASMDRVSRSASSNLAGMAATSPLHSDGSLAYRPSAAGAEAKTRLGFEFAKSSDTIVSWSNNTEAPVKVRRAASQGVEVFEALVTAGLSTAYGLNMINMVIQKQEAMASKVATTAT